MSNSQIDDIYNASARGRRRRAAALGAGGGGFMVFFVERESGTGAGSRAAEETHPRLSISADNDGSEIVLLRPNGAVGEREV